MTADTLTDAGREAINAAIGMEFPHMAADGHDWVRNFGDKEWAIYYAGKAAGAAEERERCARESVMLKDILMRWLRWANKASKQDMTIASFDKLRQDSDSAIRAAPKNAKE